MWQSVIDKQLIAKEADTFITCARAPVIDNFYKTTRMTSGGNVNIETTWSHSIGPYHVKCLS